MIEASLYRDPEEGLKRRRAELLRTRREEASALSRSMREVYAARIARMCAGGVATAGMVALVAVALRGSRGLTFVMLQIVAAVPVGYILGLAYGRLRLAKVLGEHIRPTGDVRADVARLEDGAEEVVRRLADRLERSSLVLPLVGFSMLVPLLIHFLTAQLVGRLVSADLASVTGFDRWIALGFLTLGQCFLVAAWKAWRYALRLRATATS